MGAFIACLVFGAATLAAWAWARFDRRRADREVEDAARESAELQELRAAEAAFQRRVAAAVEFVDDLCWDSEFAFERALEDVIGLAEYFCRYDAHEQGLLRLADYAEQHPMPQRPESPTADLGEPWQLNFEVGTDD